MRRRRPENVSPVKSPYSTQKRILLAAALMFGVAMFALILRALSPREPIYSAFSDSASAIRPKAMFSYNAFVYDGIKECYLEVFFVRGERTFLRMQHPAFRGQAVIEFTRAQTESFLDFLDKYLSQLSEDRLEQKKAHMVGTFHESIEARRGKRFSIVVDYRFQRLRYRLFFGNDGMSPVLDIDQFNDLREAVATALEES